MVIIFILLITICFIPIPIKIKFIYEDNVPKLFIYKFNMNLKSFSKGIKSKATSKNTKKKGSIKFQNIKMIIKKINSSNFKPRLKLKVKIEFGFSDAAITALSYGLINILWPIIYELFNVVFKIKNFQYDFNPDFNNAKVKLQANSIIFISLVNVMYMVFIIYKNIRKPLKN